MKKIIFIKSNVSSTYKIFSEKMETYINTIEKDKIMKISDEHNEKII